MPSPEAVSAGAAVLLADLGSCNPGALFNAAATAQAVFAAMAEIDPPAVKPSGLVIKVDTTSIESAIARLTETVAAFKAAVDAVQVEEG